MHTEASIREMPIRQFDALLDSILAAEPTDLRTGLAHLSGYNPAAFAYLANKIENEPEQVPHPTGFCGHPVDPAEFTQGFTECAGCRAADEVKPEPLPLSCGCTVPLAHLNIFRPGHQVECVNHGSVTVAGPLAVSQ
jgi:hypothetical protein